MAHPTGCATVIIKDVMLNTFLATLTPMLTFLICMAIGFSLRKGKLLPDNAGKVMAKLENWVFCPALSFMTMARNFKIESISKYATSITLSCIIICVALPLAIILSKVFVKNKSPERGIYAYALMFGNFGYMGDPVVLEIFGDAGLVYYKLFTIPFSILVYVWGISVLVPSDVNENSTRTEKLKETLKKVFNPPTVALILGIVVGLTMNIDTYAPLEFLTGTLDGLKACMGPVAMLLAGFTVAGYSLKGMLIKHKVYIATALRLFVLPAILIALIFGIKELANTALGLSINNDVLYCSFFAFATPLGLNTIVFPEAYGGNPETGASMAVISHTLCVITIPILFALMTELFGSPVFS